MISEMHLRIGSSPGRPSLSVSVQPSVTIFVGPNNSGKSLILREIFQYCHRAEISPRGLILDRLEFSDLGIESGNLGIELFDVETNTNGSNAGNKTEITIGRNGPRYSKERFMNVISLPNDHPRQFAQWYLQHVTLNLDGPSRISLVNPQSRGDLKNPMNPLARILTNDLKRKSLRKTILDAIGLVFAIDATEGDNLQIRFGTNEPPDERTFHDDILEYMRSARTIDAVSDGVKAFTGILLQLYAGDPKVIVIDEPEAFLHPSLSQKLGTELAKGAVSEGKHVFAATHSAHFVMGAILSGAKVNIVRLTYANDVGTARLLPSKDLTKLMYDPLLRSVGVLSGLFYDHVIVGEGDTDRAFYQEINQRLLAADDPRGVEHTLFLNAQNKDTIPRIIAPLRRLGVPAAGVVDVDVLKKGGQIWNQHLQACGIPMGEIPAYGVRRSNVLRELNERHENFKSNGGVNCLHGESREVATNLCRDLERYGFFIVQRGEVEAWLTGLNVPRTKGKWLRSIFEKMGSDPSKANYLKPGPGDVWEFIARIRAWLTSPDRNGIPY